MTITATTSPAAPRVQEPFAALPHHIAGDPRICPCDKAVLLSLLYWARAKDHCWPSDRSIGHRIGRSPATVQRALRRLEQLGLIAREQTDSNRTGRIIRLLWRARSDEGPPPSSLREPLRSAMSDEGNSVIVKEESQKKTGGSRPEPRSRSHSESPLRSRPEPAPAPPLAPTPIQVAQATVPPVAPEARPAPTETEPRPTLPPVPPPEITGTTMTAKQKTAPEAMSRAVARSQPPSPISGAISTKDLVPTLATVLEPLAPRTVPEARQIAPSTGRVPRPIPVSDPPPRASENLGSPSEERPPASDPDSGTPTGPPTLPPLVSKLPAPAPQGEALPVSAVLSPPEQARLRDLPPATREKVLEWVALGDPILLGEARRLLAPPRPAGPSPGQLSTAELLTALPGRPDWVIFAADRLARELGDQKSFRYFEGVALAVSRREQPPEALIRAWEQGQNPQARNPGAVFATVWKRETRSPG